MQFVPNNFISKQCVQTKRKNFKNLIIQTRKQLEATQHRQMLMTKPCPKRYADQNIWFHSLYVNLINTFKKINNPNKYPPSFYFFFFFNFQQFSLTTNYTGHSRFNLILFWYWSYIKCIYTDLEERARKGSKSCWMWKQLKTISQSLLDLNIDLHSKQSNS